MTDATGKSYLSTPYVSNDGIYSIYIQRYVLSCCYYALYNLFINQNILQFDDWVYLIAIVGDTNGQEIFFTVESDPTYLVFVSNPVIF